MEGTEGCLGAKLARNIRDHFLAGVPDGVGSWGDDPRGVVGSAVSGSARTPSPAWNIAIILFCSFIPATQIAVTNAKIAKVDANPTIHTVFLVSLESALTSVTIIAVLAFDSDTTIESASTFPINKSIL